MNYTRELTQRLEGFTQDEIEFCIEYLHIFSDKAEIRADIRACKKTEDAVITEKIKSKLFLDLVNRAYGWNDLHFIVTKAEQEGQDLFKVTLQIYKEKENEEENSED